MRNSKITNFYTKVAVIMNTNTRTHEHTNTRTHEHTNTRTHEQQIISQPCLICSSKTNYYFSKNYATYPGSPFKEILNVDYYKCEECGFVLSQTHAKMSENDWTQLNTSWHHHFEKNPESNTTHNQPPYADQALALKLLSKNGIININDTLDYAAGYGSMAKVLKKYFNINISIYDKYVQDIESDLTYVQDRELKKYKLVVNSAMFEHVLERKHLDAVNDLVDSDGTLMLHTVVCEKVPADPNWFYITPIVHTAFHTNKSMEILMKQWGYAASIYSPQAKSWFLFKKDSPLINDFEHIVEAINRELQTKYFHYKNGFVDYWKGF